MRHAKLLARALSGLALVLPLATAGASAQTAGVDIAFPRVVPCTIAAALAFMGPTQVVEQGDYVHWTNTGLNSHTTTSGDVCLMTTGLWDAPLNTTTRDFQRQFLEAPQSIPYHCTPHCSLGMKGTVIVTTPIEVTVSDSAGTLALTWTGGSGSYQVYRSDTPKFTGAGTTVSPPIGGATGTTFTDSTPPSPGAVVYYLVMNTQP